MAALPDTFDRDTMKAQAAELAALEEKKTIQRAARESLAKGETIEKGESLSPPFTDAAHRSF